MSGIYHSVVNPNQPNVNATNAHPGGFFEDTSIPLSSGQNSYPVRNESGQSGGRGYGMSLTQDLLGGLNNRYPLIDSYDSVGVKDDLNLDASIQHNPLMVSSKNSLPGLSSFMSGGRGRRRKSRAKKGFFGGANLTSYGFDNNLDGSNDLSLYKGSYAPITVTKSDSFMQSGSGSNPNVSLQLGGKKRRIGRTKRRFRSMRLKHKTKSRNGGRGRTHKHSKYCKHKSRSRKHRKSRNGRRGLSNPLRMTKKILEKIVGGNGTCGGPPQPQVQSGGGYSQYLGGQEFSQGYTFNDMVTPQTSALANPMSFKPYNSCQ